MDDGDELTKQRMLQHSTWKALKVDHLHVEPTLFGSARGNLQIRTQVRK
jgi:hypothetical protein